MNLADAQLLAKDRIYQIGERQAGAKAHLGSAVKTGGDWLLALGAAGAWLQGRLVSHVNGALSWNFSSARWQPGDADWAQDLAGKFLHFPDGYPNLNSWCNR